MISFQTLEAQDIETLRHLLQLLGTVFGDLETYTAHQPDDAYLQRWLANPNHLALAAFSDKKMVGGLVAYELQKFEQARSEIYIYDLAVDENYRRQGVATGLITALQKEAAQRQAYVIFVQADTSEEDAPAIALYTKLGQREDVLHFDIPVPS